MGGLGEAGGRSARAECACRVGVGEQVREKLLQCCQPFRVEVLGVSGFDAGDDLERVGEQGVPPVGPLDQDGPAVTGVGPAGHIALAF